MWRSVPIGTALLACLLTSACGGGGSLSSAPPQAPSPAGVWEGTDSFGGASIYALVDAEGNLHFRRTASDGIATYGGTLVVNPDGTVTGTYQGWGYFAGMGPTHGTGTLSGTVEERQSLILNAQFTTDSDAVLKGTLSLALDVDYMAGSSLGTIAGTYVDANGDLSSVTTITSAGTMTCTSLNGIGPSCGTGTVTLLDPTYNLYAIDLTVPCVPGTGSSSLTGLATLNASVSPHQLTIGLAATSTPCGDEVDWLSQTQE